MSTINKEERKKETSGAAINILANTKIIWTGNSLLLLLH